MFFRSKRRFELFKCGIACRGCGLSKLSMSAQKRPRSPTLNGDDAPLRERMEMLRDWMELNPTRDYSRDSQVEHMVIIFEEQIAKRLREHGLVSIRNPNPQVVQAAETRIKDLEKENADLKQKNADLEERLRVLEAGQRRCSQDWIRLLSDESGLPRKLVLLAARDGPITGMRQLVAKDMQNSRRPVPHSLQCGAAVDVENKAEYDAANSKMEDPVYRRLILNMFRVYNELNGSFRQGASAEQMRQYLYVQIVARRIDKRGGRAVFSAEYASKVLRCGTIADSMSACKSHANIFNDADGWREVRQGTNVVTEIVYDVVIGINETNLNGKQFVGTFRASPADTHGGFSSQRFASDWHAWFVSSMAQYFPAEMCRPPGMSLSDQSWMNGTPPFGQKTPLGVYAWLVFNGALPGFLKLRGSFQEQLNHATTKLDFSSNYDRTWWDGIPRQIEEGMHISVSLGAISNSTHFWGVVASTAEGRDAETQATLILHIGDGLNSPVPLTVWSLILTNVDLIVNSRLKYLNMKTLNNHNDRLRELNAIQFNRTVNGCDVGSGPVRWRTEDSKKKIQTFEINVELRKYRMPTVQNKFDCAFYAILFTSMVTSAVRYGIDPALFFELYLNRQLVDNITKCRENAGRWFDCFLNSFALEQVTEAKRDALRNVLKKTATEVGDSSGDEGAAGSGR